MTARPLTYPRTHRLSSPLRFKAVYDARVRDTRGPLVIYALPNRLQHCRLGLSVSRRVGTAPRRNRIKRLLRESFRAMQHDMPGAYDLVIVLRPHVPMTLAEYQGILRAAVAKVHSAWERRPRDEKPPAPKPADDSAPKA
ncbi:MAG TPA: ribonuclease P protein component [Tepidisphaeraceae bacterium]|jgi:ribonuclease P protein component|nr:ribonuclease P protein component [Tepidisphaeraceae bacterium]